MLKPPQRLRHIGPIIGRFGPPPLWWSWWRSIFDHFKARLAIAFFPKFSVSLVWFDGMAILHRKIIHHTEDELLRVGEPLLIFIRKVTRYLPQHVQIPFILKEKKQETTISFVVLSSYPCTSFPASITFFAPPFKITMNQFLMLHLLK